MPIVETSLLAGYNLPHLQLLGGARQPSSVLELHK
jgi:hypothetical protein